MASTKRNFRTTEEHLQLGLPVLFSELLVFRWTPSDGFPKLSEDFRASFERMQEVENLDNELRVFFGSFDGALASLEDDEVRKNTFKFIDQYGTISDILKTGLLRQASSARNMVPEYLEERIRNQTKWYRGNDEFSIGFAKEFLRRKFSSMRSSFRAPQPTSLLPPVPPPRRNRSGGSAQADETSQPSTSHIVSSYTASGRLRRNSAPSTSNNRSPVRARTMTAEELPSPPPTPPPITQTEPTQGHNDSTEEVDQSQRVPSTPPRINTPANDEDDQDDDQQPPDIDNEPNNNDIQDKAPQIIRTKVNEVERPLQETAM